MAFHTLALILAGAMAAALLGAYLLWRGARAARAASGLPSGQVVYADTADWQRSDPLYDPELRLAGKPDYIVHSGRHLIPVEVKPSRRPAPGPAPQPYASDTLQLAAYGLLVEAAFRRRPPHGLLRYRDLTFQVPLTPSLRRVLLRQLAEMRRDLGRRNVPRDHADPRRCRYCGYRSHCDQSLV